MRQCLLALLLSFMVLPVFGETLISGTITTSVSWILDGSPYIISGDVLVASSSSPVISIEEGVQVRFNAGASLRLGSTNSSSSRGGLIVNGTELNPVIFTANTDSPAPGFWNSIKMNSYCLADQVVLNHAILEYGGSGGGGLFDVNSVSPELNNCIFRHSSSYGIYHTSTTVNAVVNSCHFISNAGYPLHINVPGASQISGAICFSGNGIQRILLRSVVLSSGCTWQNHGVPYELENDLNVQSTSSPVLTLTEGLQLLFRQAKGIYIGSNSSSSSIGAINATGVSFTASDTLLLWRGIEFQPYSRASSLIDCSFSFVSNQASGAITQRGNYEAVIQDCEIYNVDNYALSVSSGKPFSLTGCNIHHCAKTIALNFQDIHGLGLGNNYQDNGDNRIHASGGTLDESATWTRQHTSVLILGNCYVSGPSPYPELEIPYGSILEFSSGTSLAIGSATTTSYRGSIRASGATFRGVEAVPGYWIGLVFYSYGANSLVSGCIIRDAGYGNAAAVQFTVVNSTLTGCTIFNNAAKGINLANNSLASISGNVIFGCGSYPLSLDANAVRVLGEGNYFTGNTIDRIEVRHETITNSGVWRNPGVPYYLTGSVGIFGTNYPHLKILPGASVLLPDGALITVGHASTISYLGSLEAEGVIFTRADESAVPWGFLFNRYCNVGRSVFTDCVFEYFLHSTNQCAINVPYVADPVFNGCTFRYNPGMAILGGSGARAAVNNCSFISNGSYPISLGAASFDVVSGVGNSFMGNNPDRILLSGGTLSQSYTWDNPSVPVEISSSISVYGSSHPVLTINSGLLMLFRDDTELAVGHASTISYSGGLKAEGARFSALSGVAGSWNGIQLNRYIDSNSFLKDCIVEYGGASGDGNVFFSYSSFGLIEGSIIRFAPIGIKLQGTQSVPLISSSHVVSNEIGILCQNSANPTIGGSMDHSNSISGNSLYGVQNTGSPTIDASYNWWGHVDGPNLRYGDSIIGNLTHLPYRTTDIGDAPGQFDLSSPVHLAVLDHLRPVLDWEEALDPSPGDTVLYNLEISSNPGFSRSLLQYTNLSTTVFHVSEGVLDDDGHYYWRVIASDNQGQSTQCNQVYEFFTSVPEAPLAFNLMNPGWEELVTVTSPLLSWQPSLDPDPGDMVSYRVYISLTAGFEESDSLLTSDTELYSTYCQPGALYYWKVLAVDSTGLYRESPVGRFFVDQYARPRAPGRIVLSAEPSLINLNWDEVPGAELYRLYYALDPGDAFEYLGQTELRSYQHINSADKCFYYIEAIDQE